MNEHKASRTLVKSPPELWAECSDATSLTRHLDHFGEIKITKLDPETAVAWEGERVSGTVRIEPAGWGTRVTLTAAVDEDPAAPEAREPEPVAVAETEPEPEPVAVAEPEPEPEPVAVAETEPEPEPVAVAEPEPVPPPPVDATPARPRGLLARLIDLLGLKPAAPPPGPPVPALSEPEAEPEPEPTAAEDRCGLPLPEGGNPQHPESPEPEPAPEPEPVAPEPVVPEVSPVVAALSDAEAALVAALDSLGQAHHRPFSRA